MCFLLGSLYLDCGHVTFHPAICAFNPTFLNDLLEPGDVIHQMTDTTLTIRTTEGEFKNLMAEPLNGRPQYSTFCKTTPTYSVLDCIHFENERGVKEVHTFGLSCPTCGYAGEVVDSANHKKSSNKAPLHLQTKKSQIWKHYFSRHILQFARRRETAQEDDKGPTNECDLRFLSSNLTKTAKQSKGWKGLFGRSPASGKDGKIDFEPGCDHLQSITVPKSLLEDLKQGRLGSGALQQIASAKKSGGKLVLSVTGEEQCWACAQEGLGHQRTPDSAADDWEWWGESTE